jgi:hypothetical protein
LQHSTANCPAGATTVAFQQTTRGSAEVAVAVLVFADNAGHALRSRPGATMAVKSPRNLYDNLGRASEL